MTNLIYRLNLDTEDVEVVVDGQVVDTMGVDVVASWVAAINEKHAPAPVEDKPEETGIEGNKDEVEAPADTDEVTE